MNDIILIDILIFFYYNYKKKNINPNLKSNSKINNFDLNKNI
jgi:hypothetical protein